MGILCAAGSIRMQQDSATLWSRGYKPGENWVFCQLCGFRCRASQARRIPRGLHQGLWVCPRDYDEYNPQYDSVYAVDERIVPDKLSPEPDGTTIGTNTEDSPSAYDGSQKITGDDL